MEEMTSREKELIRVWEDARKQKIISIKDLDKLMVAVHKLLMNYRDAVVSRDYWKKKYDALKEKKNE